MVRIETFPAPELGNASFLVADTDRGVALVVDPFRDVDAYLDRAGDLGVRITHALDTHLHNDFVSGRRELESAAGTHIAELAPDDEVAIGAVSVRAIHTPGHTPDHKGYVLAEGGRPRALFSGGAVMVGGVARTDLFGPHLAAHLGLEMLRTLQVRLRGLPDDIAVYPTHGSGSFCGTATDGGHETTLGRERETNPFFLTTEVMPFLARILDQHRFPDYYRDMAAVNSKGAPLLGRSPAQPPTLTAGDVAARMEAGAAVVDVRSGRDYDTAHIPGSYSVPVDAGSFSAWVGWLVPRERDIVLAGGTPSQHADATRQLRRIGFDRVVGVLDGGMDAWKAAGRALSHFETATIEDMAKWILDGEEMTVVDARDDHEWGAGHAPGSVHMYVPDIPHHAHDIPAGKPVAVHCASGHRAGIAASLLEQAGLKRVIHVNGDYGDWHRLHLAEVRM